MQLEIIPAILVKSREELLSRIALIQDHVNIIQLDIMDGEFVPNKTIGLESLHDLPNANYEFHWMVFHPEKWIEKTPGPHMHLVHVETINDFDKLIKTVKQAGGKLGLAINPETPVEKLMPYLSNIEEVLVMTVRPGFSGQTYLANMEEKIRKIRELKPDMNIEVDGGVCLQTIHGAYVAGANYLAAASAIFSGEVKTNIENLKKTATRGCQE
ncbi:ribulose-phosphate 3-epimerase [Candidatus Micrarchaeota archaeon]|nr:ribulose-phosphate 3-epimerase [Candidatus Micrarchaeota archaeon]MBU1681331.1 ribulose-phosphate 3-epimerase [Candidatus Micrarchaeota archaeon]